MGKGEQYIEGAEGKGHRQRKELMGKGRGCGEEEREEESSRRSGREGSQAAEGDYGKRERLWRGRMGREEQ
jgi:hypothetical protein